MWSGQTKCVKPVLRTVAVLGTVYSLRAGFWFLFKYLGPVKTFLILGTFESSVLDTVLGAQSLTLENVYLWVPGS